MSWPPVTHPEAGSFEKALGRVNAARFAEIGPRAEILRTLWSAFECPASELSFLAWALSVDVWDEAWPEARQRRVIAESPAYHRLKTTIAADRMACVYGEGELINYHLPRDGFAVGPVPSPEARARWLASLPEIRVYETPPRPSLVPSLGGAIGLTPSCRAIGIDRARRAELRRGGAVTALVVSGETHDPDGRGLTEIERVALPAPAAAHLAVGIGAISRPVGAPKSRRIFSFSWRASSENPFDLRPGVPTLRAAEARARRIAIVKPHRPHRVIVGRTRLDSAIGPAPRRGEYYLSLRLADGSGPSGARPRQGAVGLHRLRRRPFTKELSVSLTRRSRRGWPFTGRRLIADPRPRVVRLIGAIATAQAARDTVAVNLNVTRALTVADLGRIDETTRIGHRVMMARRLDYHA